MIRYGKFDSKSDFETKPNVSLWKGRKCVWNLKCVIQFYIASSQRQRSQKKDMRIMLQKNDLFYPFLYHHQKAVVTHGEDHNYIVFIVESDMEPVIWMWGVWQTIHFKL